MRKKQLLEELLRRLDMLDAYLVIRDPGTARSADAYDGLRKLLIQSNKGSQIHLAHLAQIDYALSFESDAEVVRAKVGEAMEQVGLQRMDSTKTLQRTDEAFDVVAGDGPETRVVTPAYIDINTRQVVRRGTVELVASSSNGDIEEPDAGHDEEAPPTEPEPTNAGDGA